MILEPEPVATVTSHRTACPRQARHAAKVAHKEQQEREQQERVEKERFKHQWRGWYQSGASGWDIPPPEPTPTPAAQAAASAAAVAPAAAAAARLAAATASAAGRQWVPLSKALRECRQCKQTRSKGRVDLHDGLWYCDACWGGLEA